ncbi:MAG: AraC family transcriptional regulator [Erysipelotrichaceae bacterium]|nr:AraC family transcriptional regulator [Erysipelotrichaceae bacterium]
MKKKIIKAQNISITKCTNSLVLLVLDGQCSVLKFNKIKNYQKQDVIFIEKDDIYALKGNCILAIIELEKNEIKDTELVDALDSMDLKKDVSNTYRDCIFIKNLLSVFNNDEHIKEIVDALQNDYCLLNNFHHHLLQLTNSQKKLYLDVKKIVSDNYSCKLSLNDIAYALNIQKNLLCTKFKEISTGTINQYINTIRLKKAQELLLIDNMDSDEIIKKCGFSDRKYFYRYFKECFGYTPLQYKAAMESYRTDNYKTITNEGKYYLDLMKKELDSLDTDTHFYLLYKEVKKLEQLANISSTNIICDVLNPRNYLHIDNESINTWYGFDLLNSYVLKYQLSLEIVFILDKNTTIKQLDEALNLLDKSRNALDSRIIKNWNFSIIINDINTLNKKDYLLNRLKSLFKENRTNTRISL